MKAFFVNNLVSILLSQEKIGNSRNIIGCNAINLHVRRAVCTWLPRTCLRLKAKSRSRTCLCIFPPPGEKSKNNHISYCDDDNTSLTFQVDSTFYFQTSFFIVCFSHTQQIFIYISPGEYMIIAPCLLDIYLAINGGRKNLYHKSLPISVVRVHV